MVSKYVKKIQLLLHFFLTWLIVLNPNIVICHLKQTIFLTFWFF